MMTAIKPKSAFFHLSQRQFPAVADASSSWAAKAMQRQ
jgi:hypothetical protein